MHNAVNFPFNDPLRHRAAEHQGVIPESPKGLSGIRIFAPRFREGKLRGNDGNTASGGVLSPDCAIKNKDVDLAARLISGHH